MATAHWASCQPRSSVVSASLRPGALPVASEVELMVGVPDGVFVAFGTGTVTVRPSSAVLALGTGVGFGVAPFTSAAASWKASRPKSRTSASRTASGPVAVVTASGRPWQVRVAAA